MKQCNAVCYLLGDEHQRMYRWRGARECFETVAVVAELNVANSFRFESTILEIARNLWIVVEGSVIGYMWQSPLRNTIL